MISQTDLHPSPAPHFKLSRCGQHHEPWSTFYWVFIYYGSNYYVYVHETNTFAVQFCLIYCVCDDTVGVWQDSGSIKSLCECHLFFSVCQLTVNCEESDCSLVYCDFVCFFMWRCASASAPLCRHKQYERSEVKVRVFINSIHCWPSGM